MSESIVKIRWKAYESCRQYTADALKRVKDAMKDAQEAANEESKSSSGDKYETGHAMMMLEKEKFSGQHAQLVQMQRVIDQIEPDRKNIKGRLGALMVTSGGWYYLAISAGKIDVDGTSIFAVSLASPIGQLLENKAAGEEVMFNGKKLTIQEVY